MPVGVMVSDCRASLDLVTIQGVDPERVRAFRSLPVAPAAWTAFTTQESAALVGGTLARRYGWTAGTEVTLPRLQGISFTIEGIIPETGGVTDQMIYLPLSFLQNASVGQGICNQLWVKTVPGAPPAAVAGDVDQAMRGHAIATHTRLEEQFLRDTTADVRRLVEMLQIVAWVAVGVVLVAIANTIAITMRERTGELAVLRTLGYPRGLIAGMATTEAMLVAVVGGAVGIGAAWLLLGAGTVGIGIEGVVFRPAFGHAGLREAVTVAIAVGVAGALPPALIAVNQSIVDGLRRVD